jgi:hypothetical protein
MQLKMYKFGIAFTDNFHTKFCEDSLIASKFEREDTHTEGMMIW